MLTIRENLNETIHGGHPDRFVNQFEFIELIYNDPIQKSNPEPKYGETNVINAWGITNSWPIGTPGVFPVHDDLHKCVKNILDWKNCVKAPTVYFSDAEWEPALAAIEQINRREKYAAIFQQPGLFEQLHHLMGIEETLVNFYEEADAVHDLIKYLTEWELDAARVRCDHMRPDALFHHDDWGSQTSTFFSTSMFEDFFMDAYKEIYQYHRERGVELIVHHSDSYAETLVPYMIECGIDIWQGVMTTNNIPEMIRKYGGKISFMGGINSATIDHPDWSREEISREVRRACEEYGKLYFIPGASQGAPFSTFNGVYETMSEEIRKLNQEIG